MLPTPSTNIGSTTDTVHVLLSAEARPAEGSTRPSQHAPPLPHLQRQKQEAQVLQHTLAFPAGTTSFQSSPQAAPPNPHLFDTPPLLISEPARLVFYLLSNRF